MGVAFGQAWKEIADNLAGKPDGEAARIKLAEAMLFVVREGVSGVEALKTNALQVMAQDYRTGRG